MIPYFTCNRGLLVLHNLFADVGVMNTIGETELVSRVFIRMGHRRRQIAGSRDR
jgi:hypothetical protein